MQANIFSLIFKFTELSLLSSQFCCEQRIHLTLGLISHTAGIQYHGSNGKACRIVAVDLD
jgi:hypothetical protein